MAKEKGSKKIAELEGQLRRALADYANLQKRIESEKAQFVSFGKEIVLGKFLHLLDTLEALEKSQNFEQFKQGLELVNKQFKKILQEEEVEEISQNEEFDPSVHEAIGVDKGEKENAISAVVQKGFKIGERVLRPVRVKVFKKEV